MNCLDQAHGEKTGHHLTVIVDRPTDCQTTRSTRRLRVLHICRYTRIQTQIGILGTVRVMSSFTSTLISLSKDCACATKPEGWLLLIVPTFRP